MESSPNPAASGPRATVQGPWLRTIAGQTELLPARPGFPVQARDDLATSWLDFLADDWHLSGSHGAGGRS